MQGVSSLADLFSESVCCVTVTALRNYSGVVLP